MQDFQSRSAYPYVDTTQQNGQVVIEEIIVKEVDNREFIPKAEFEFHSHAQLHRPLKLLRKLSIVSIFLSAYELVYGATSLALFPTSYNIISTFIGLSSLILSFVLTIWSTKTLRIEEDTTLLTQGLRGEGWERVLRSLYVALLFRAAGSLPIIVNMLSLKNYTPEHLRAYAATFEEPRYHTLGDTLSTLAAPLPILELLLCITFVQGARLCFRYLQNPSQTMTRVIYLGSLALMASALSLIYNTRVSKDYYTANHLSSLFASEDLSAFGVMGVGFVVLAFGVWLMNYKKWRVPTVTLSVILGVLIVGVAVASLSGYTNTHNVYTAYQDTSDLSVWSDKMEATFKPDIEAFGCPAKYLPPHMCESPILDTVFTPHETVDGESAKCLNTACSDLLGEFYAAPFLAASNSALMAAVSSLLILVGFLYFWYIQWRDLGVRRKGDFKWLGMLFGMVMLFSVMMMSHKGSYFRQYENSSQVSVSVNELTRPMSVEINELEQRPMSVDVNVNEMTQRPLSVDVNELTQRPLSVDVNEMTQRPLTVDTNEMIQRPISVDTNELTQRPLSVDTNEMTQRPLTVDVNEMNQKPNSDLQVEVNTLSKPQRTKPHIRVKELSKMSKTEQTTSTDASTPQSFTTTVKKAFTATVKNLGAFKTTLKVLGTGDTPSSSSLILASNDDSASPYADAFQGLVDKKFKFIVLSHDPNDPQNVEILAGPWTMNFDHFISNFEKRQEQVGFIQIGETGREQIYQVIYTPKKVRPGQVLSNFFLPANTNELSSLGLHDVRTYVARKEKELDLQKIVLEATNPGIISFIALSQAAQDQQSTADYSDSDSPFGDVFDDLSDKHYRFVILKRSPEDPLGIDVAAAPWECDVDDFVSYFDDAGEQVGFIYLGEEGQEQLYLVVYTPDNNAKLSQVLDDFSLPSNIHDLNDFGLKNVHAYVARNSKDLDLQKIKAQNIVDEVTSLFSMSEMTSIFAFENSPYASAFNALVAKKYRFIILKHDPQNNQNIKLDAGPWDWLYGDFANAFDEYREQVGFIYLGQAGKEKLYMVVYNPKYLNKKDGLILDGFGLPRDVSELQKQGLTGLNYYVAQSKNDLTLDNTIMKGRNSGIINLLEISEPSILAFENSPYASAFNALVAKKYRFIILKHDPQNYQNIKLDAGPWDWLYGDFANTFDEYREQVGFIYLGQAGKEKLYMVVYNPKYLNKKDGLILDGFGLPRDISQLQKQGLTGLNYYVAQNKNDLTLDNTIMKGKSSGVINFLEMSSATTIFAAGDQQQQSPFINIFNALASKKYRFVILKHDTQNFSNIKIDAGSWDWLFSDFANAFDAYREQVGFVYLGQQNKENLYMVVSNPKYLNKNGAQILQGFGLPTTGAELQKQGLSQLPYIYVAKDLNEITLENIIMQSKKGGTVAMI